MANKNIKTAISLMIMTALVAGIGCGDGKRNKRGKIDRPTNPAGKTNPKAGATGGETPAKDGGVLNEEARKAREANEKKVKDLWASQMQGTGVNVKDLEVGTYTFEGVVTNLEVRPAGSSEWVDAVMFSTKADGQLTDGENAVSGVLKDGDQGYALTIPDNFKVEQNPFVPAAGLNPVYNVFTQLVTAKDGTAKLKNILQEADKQSAGVMMDILDIGKDANGKTVEVSIFKTEDGRVRFHLVSVISSDEGSVTRKFLLTYKFTKAAGHETAAADSSVKPLPVATDEAAK